MEDHTAANRANWNAWTRINAASTHYDVAGFKAGRSSLKPLEIEEVGEVAGKTLLHLQCHFGLDTLSWARRGALVTGVDFSDEAIVLARSLADEVGLAARFICSDLYALPEVLDERFDIVFTSYGVLFWLRDLGRWAEVVARYLKPGGVFYIAELHPFANVFDNDEGVTELRPRWPYTHAAGPVPNEVQGTYADPQDEFRAVEYCWSFGLGEVITAVIAAGLRIEWVHEFPYMWEQHGPLMAQRDDGAWGWADPANTIPLLFSLRARRET